MYSSDPPLTIPPKPSPTIKPHPIPTRTLIFPLSTLREPPPGFISPPDSSLEFAAGIKHERGLLAIAHQLGRVAPLEVIVRIRRAPGERAVRVLVRARGEDFGALVAVAASHAWVDLLWHCFFFEEN